MKTILTSFLMLLVSSQAFALGLSDVAGKYRAIPVEFPYIKDTIELRSNGTVTVREELTEDGKIYVASFGVDPDTMGPVTCQGSATISGKVVRSNLKCNDGTSFTQSIDLNGVNYHQSDFMAHVETTANDASGTWVFKRL